MNNSRLIGPRKLFSFSVITAIDVAIKIMRCNLLGYGRSLHIIMHRRVSGNQWQDVGSLGYHTCAGLAR